MNEISVLEKDVASALEVAKSFEIKTSEDFKVVDAHCVSLLELKNKIVEDFKASKSAAWLAHKAIVSQEKGHLDGIDDARRIEKEKMVEWMKNQVVPTCETVIRKNYGYEIIDADKIPKKYLMPDDRKILSVVKSMGNATKIPGVKVFEKYY